MGELVFFAIELPLKMESVAYFSWKVCLLLRWKLEDYSTGEGLDSRRLCLLLCFLTFLELQICTLGTKCFWC